MSPFIRDGDVLVLSAIRRGLIGVGQVVLFIHPHAQTLVVHRIVGRIRKHYFVKGDNMFSPDGWVHINSILGVVIKVEREGELVTFGLGKERILIAFLSRRTPFFNWFRFIRRYLKRFFTLCLKLSIKKRF